MNKITYGLSNLMYATISVDESGDITYNTPKSLPGAKEMSLEPTGESTKIYADDKVYVTISPGTGYDGDLTVLTVPEVFATEVLGMQKDKKGVLIESEDDVQTPFALLGEFKTDTATKKRFVLYNCTAGKTSFGGKTKEESVEAQEYAIPITVTAASDTGIVKAVATNEEATKTQFDSWFTQVYIPIFDEAA